MRNKEVAQLLSNFAVFLEMDDVPFKPRAYEKAAETIEALEGDIEEIYRIGGTKALENISGVGKGIAEKIEEYLKTGFVKEYNALAKKIPVKLTELRSIEGIGPKTIKTLYRKLKITDIASLKKAALAQKIRRLPHFGLQSEEKILKGIGFYERSRGRFLLGEVLPLARSFAEQIGDINGVKRVEVAGSLRRWQETIGDLDFLVIADDPKRAMNAFVRLPGVTHVYAKGETKSSVRLSSGLDMDIRIIPRESYGAALQYFTGSKDHNVIVRKIAAKKGLKLNEYGLFRGKKRIAGETEESVYKALGLATPIPELRQGRDELERVWHNIIESKHLQGDLQTQTDWTDGAHSIREMAAEAQKLGREYIAITDHTKSLAMTGGSDEKKLLKQMREIDRINRSLDKITLLKGAEVNIARDGSLDIADDVLARLDIVGAAIHSHFGLSAADQTRRLVRAMENQHVDIIFHPTGRVLGKREPYALYMKDVVASARRTGTVLEIDAHPYRLDLKDEHIREAAEAGCFFAIDSDAHRVQELSYLEYGVGQARRAGLAKDRVINTYPLKKLEAFLSKPKKKRFSL